ncbi:MAG: tetratricopeptide repeat protein [Gammaproteobacteria bacterium]|nr:tetratricopeptide repeat protein [Gammaproteobacteria bacterium]
MCSRWVVAWVLVVISVWSVELSAATLDQLEQRFERGDNNLAPDLEAFLQQSPHAYPALILKARWLTKQGKTDAALMLYQQLIKQQPNQPDAYNNLAGLLAKKGDLAGAQKLLEQALHTHPSYAAVYENLTTLNVEQARSSYGKALNLDQPTNPIVLQEITPRDIPAAATAPVATTVAQHTAVVVETKPSVPPQPGVTPLPCSTSVTPVSTPAPISVVMAASPIAQALTKSNSTHEQIITTLQGWATAWSGKAAEVYFSFYDKSFSPPGIPRSRWEAQRRERLAEPPWIKVGLSEFKIKTLAHKQTRVRFIQDYQAPGYRDRIRKEILLHYTDDGWRIIAERKIAALH